ncbi:MAG: YfcE family phosphodiesterase [Hydrotalea flava]|uniref:metallophosphoesterase family protein n=1 Tax=Hydrotalea TaxID=1004300 RepID=UPI0016A77F6F|nr:MULTISPECIES: metallophosphoesterase family protein [Hydrotalea]MBY0349211.1 metallophosphatase family protein [Hydrotalea flava]NIM33915.1 YfcE family phosphodiesterase [Hydrotalea flava]NIM36744.1 YfcE family phosphodiesterase [Hydrotalea flava]NIN01930.1 YfcE family phosphodiesterase [Hydrotalea flava]NIN13588.1 YfcE family phosphodiesterase [Hydrotalea flava]
MMKIAVFSDVHANLPALKAVYAHIEKQQPDAIYCLGDWVNQNIWNNEVIDFMQQHHIPSVLGNHDEGIGNNKAKYPFSYGSREEIDWGLDAIQYSLQQITEDRKAILRALPLKLKVKLLTGQQQRTLLFAHGTPKSNTERIYRFYKQAELSKILDDEAVDVLMIGNTHTSFHKQIERIINGKKTYQHIINPGSVGSPKDGSWHACYAIVEIDTKKDIKYNPEALQVNFYRLDYDIDTVIKGIKNSPLHIYYAVRLLKY